MAAFRAKEAPLCVKVAALQAEVAAKLTDA
jgi:hypothetical protein